MKNFTRKDFLYTAAGTLAAAALAGPAFAAEATEALLETEAAEPVEFTQEELDRMVYELKAKSEIQELMADYWWYMDTKQPEKWKDVFTEDFKFYNQGNLIADSRDYFVETNLNVWLVETVSAHQGHQNKIIFTSPTTATGRFILNDILSNKDTKEIREGRGYYIGEYVKCDDGKWRIGELKLGYIRFDRDGDATLNYTPSYEGDLC